MSVISSVVIDDLVYDWPYFFNILDRICDKNFLSVTLPHPLRRVLYSRYCTLVIASVFY